MAQDYGEFTTRLVKAAAKEQGVPARWINLPELPERVRRGAPATGRFLLLPGRRGDYLYRWVSLRRLGADKASVGPHINGPSLPLTKNKAITKALTSSVSVGTPRGLVFSREQRDGAERFFDYLGPACIKPANGMRGNLVFPRVTNRKEFLHAFKQVSRRFRHVLVEESVGGDNFRFFFLGGEIVGINLSRPANVVGNGVDTVQRLVDAQNALRRDIPAHEPIQIDELAQKLLAKSGLSRESVPGRGVRVPLGLMPQCKWGGETEPCKDRIHPSYIEEIARACRAFPGLVSAGVDVMIEDFSKPAKPGNYWLLEINSGPGLILHHFPTRGASQDIAGAIVHYINSPGAHDERPSGFGTARRVADSLRTRFARRTLYGGWR